MERRWFTHEWRVRYSETDQMGVVYHANYANWLEIGRTELIRELGISYREIEDRGLLLPLTELNIRYKQAARYDDLIQIRTSVREYSAIRLCFEAQITSNERIVAEGTTHHVWVNREWKPAKLDKAFPELYELIRTLGG